MKWNWTAERIRYEIYNIRKVSRFQLFVTNFNSDYFSLATFVNKHKVRSLAIVF